MSTLFSISSRQDSLPTLADKSPSWSALTEEAVDLLNAGAMSFGHVLRLSAIAVKVQCLLQERSGGGGSGRQVGNG